MNDKKIDRQDVNVMTDAVRMLKSQFTELYCKMGYDEKDTGIAWHQIRVSSAGRTLMEKEYKGMRHIQAKTFISDMDEEANERLNKKPNNNKMTKKEKSIEQVPAKETEVVEPKPTKEKKVKVPKEPKSAIVDSDRGKKTAVAKELIAGGETNAAIIAEKSGAAVAYVRTLLYNYRKSQKAPKKD